MNTWIALLRGINVGGHHKLPMNDLKTVLGTLGFADIQTYIQSGNVVFRSRTSDAIDLANSIQQAIDDGFGFAPGVLVISLDELSETVHQNPFREAESDPKTLHVSFAVEAPESPHLEGMEALLTNGESFSLIGRCFYLHAPNGIGRSKLAAQVEQLLGVSATSRNWRTISRLLEMAQSVSS